jgi:hypothetical protein
METKREAYMRALRNAAKTLKNRGLKANMKMRQTLTAHRKTGASNEEFFAAATPAPHIALPKQGTRAAANNAYKQAKENLTRRFAEYGKKPPSYLTHKLAAARRKGKNNSQIQAEIEAKLAALGAPRAPPAPAPAPAAPAPVSRTTRRVRIQTPGASAPAVSEFVTAGLKAPSSAKGKAWLQNVEKARNMLTKVLQDAGVNAKASRTDATKYASILRTGDVAKAKEFQTAVVQEKKQGRTLLVAAPPPAPAPVAAAPASPPNSSYPTIIS